MLDRIADVVEIVTRLVADVQVQLGSAEIGNHLSDGGDVSSTSSAFFAISVMPTTVWKFERLMPRSRRNVSMPCPSCPAARASLRAAPAGRRC